MELQVVPLLVLGALPTLSHAAPIRRVAWHVARSLGYSGSRALHTRTRMGATLPGDSSPTSRIASPASPGTVADFATAYQSQFHVRELTEADWRQYQHSHHIGPDAVGRIHSMESFTTLDGPGIRYLVFLQGCAMRCLFCSNRDTASFTDGTLVTASEIVSQVSRVAPFLKPNRGGITISGGEPMLQPTFVASLFDEVHKLGLTTCLDTNGQGTKQHHWDIVLPRADHVLFCIKHMDPRKYELLTHMRQEPALQFAKELANRKIPYYLRYVYIPGWTDDPRDMDKLIEFAQVQPSLQAIELLPYHVMGKQKWEQMKIPYPLEGVQPPSIAKVREEVKKMEKAGLKVICNVNEPGPDRWMGSRS